MAPGDDFNGTDVEAVVARAERSLGRSDHDAVAELNTTSASAKRRYGSKMLKL